MSDDAVNEDALYVELAQRTPLSIQQWKDILSLDPAARAEVVSDWNALGNLSWTKDPSTMDRVEAILNLLAAIATPVSTIVGGLTGIGALVTTLKAI